MSNYKEITNWKNKYFQAELIKQIHQLVITLTNSKTIYNRRKLVDFLNEGNNDLNLKEGIILKYILEEAYKRASHSKLIQDGIVKCFIENIGNDSIYNPNRIFINTDSLNFEDNYLDKFDNKIKLIENNANNVRSIDFIDELNQTHQKSLQITRKDEFSITGSTKVDNAYEYASSIKQGYENIINKYNEIKDINLNLISDFEFLRNELKLLRLDLINLLVDLFGDSIKVSEPELFDFSRLEWMDFEDTWGNLNLYFNNIDQSLESFKILHEAQMNKIGDSSMNIGKNAINNLNRKSKKGSLSTKDIKGELAGAVVGMAIEGVLGVAKSRSESKKTIATINKDVEALKKGMHSDYSKMMNDLLRIASIFSHLNDVLIPGFKVFINTVTSIVKNDIKPLYNEIKSIDGIKEKRDNNALLIKESRLIDLELVDKENSLIFCDNEKVRFKNELADLKFENDFLIEIKPEEPSVFYNLVSFGKSGTLYKETLEEWNIYCLPKVYYYNELKQLLANQDVFKNQLNNDIESLGNRKIVLEGLIKQQSAEIFMIFNKSEYSKANLKDLLIQIKQISGAAKNTIAVELLMEDLKVAI
ncbi:hypothetical protein [Formosa sp. L2A11]|uniref:hypothetical protein n=1 Tax=Formosa sp. L2A11 TaxID=2686363 RepID=UPI00131E3BF5|nr:hypothetical protein [Formosa sp. L2A11]